MNNLKIKICDCALNLLNLLDYIYDGDFVDAINFAISDNDPQTIEAIRDELFDNDEDDY